MTTRYCDVKITILKKLQLDEVYSAHAAEGVHATCTKFKEGQHFVSKNAQKPERFCSWAWVAIQDKVVFLGLGHDYPWIKQKGTEVVCCADGLHPVIFKLERIENRCRVR